MPTLTDEQKQQMKMAHRAMERLNETWSLYSMFLSQDKRPREALELAQEAVAVWADFQDNNEIEPPDIDRPDFGEQMQAAMQKVADTIKSANPPIPFYLQGDPVEFAPPPKPPSPTAEPLAAPNNEG